jgi:hypothetical protein
MRKSYCLAFLLFTTVLLFGCIGNNSNKTPINIEKINSDALDYAKIGLACYNICESSLEKWADLNFGPCLGLVSPDWVCDVAHNPRIAVDDLPTNQCADYRNGVAHHFVEVDTNCNLIRVS